MSSSLEWALGQPISDGHFAFTFALVFFGGAKLFQSTCAAFNATRYGWGTTAPAWIAGCYMVQVGMATALTSQPNFLVDAPRFAISIFGAVMAIVIIAAPLTKFVMAVGYLAAISCWLTTLGAALIVGATSGMIGAATLKGTPKVTHWQGDVNARDRDSNPWKDMSKERMIVKEGGSIQALSKSSAIVSIAGHRIIMMPGSEIRVAELGDEPRVEVKSGFIYSKCGPAANGKLRYETISAGIKISGANAMIMLANSGATSVIVSKGILSVGRTIETKDLTRVRKRHFVEVAQNVSVPEPIVGELVQELRMLERYSENPFAPANRRMVSGREDRQQEKPEPPKEMPQKPEMPDSKSDGTNAAPASTNAPAPSASGTNTNSPAPAPEEKPAPAKAADAPAPKE